MTKRDNPAFYPGSLGCPINCYVGDVDRYNSQITDVWNVSPTFINELRMGYTNQLNFFATQTAGKGIPAALGLQRNSVYGPGLENFDLSAGKTFNLWAERYKFQLRVDATNALNHANFSNPGTSLGTGSAGVITGTQNNGRNLQLGGRFSF